MVDEGGTTTKKERVIRPRPVLLFLIFLAVLAAIVFFFMNLVRKDREARLLLEEHSVEGQKVD